MELQKLVTDEDIVILPIGFRCYTKDIITKKLGIKQQTLPFDNGFFPAQAIASVIEEGQISIGDDSVCIKTEMNKDPKFGLGIKFISTTYDHINSLLISKDIPDINKYLDVTFGYYTLDCKHKFVLAHYNSHPFSNRSKIDPKENVKNINDMLNRRIERMMKMCVNAKHIFMLFEEHQNYKYMQLDNEYFILNDFDRLMNVCKNMFGSKFTVYNITHMTDVSKKIMEKL